MSDPVPEKPSYRNRYPCPGCSTGYIDCLAGWGLGLMCCRDCDGHPGRREAGANAYTPVEIEDMKRRQVTRA